MDTTTNILTYALFIQRLGKDLQGNRYDRSFIAEKRGNLFPRDLPDHVNTGVMSFSDDMRAWAKTPDFVGTLEECRAHAVGPIFEYSFPYPPDPEPRIDPEISDYADERAYVCEQCGETKPESAFPDQEDDMVICTACMTTCRACGGAHHIQQCERIRYALFAPVHRDPECRCGDRGPAVIVNHEAVHIHHCRTFGAIVVHYRGRMLQATWNSHVEALNAMEQFIPAYRVRLMRDAAKKAA